MGQPIATALVSGLLVLVATLAGAFVQASLSRRKEFQIRRVELRTEHYGKLSAAMAPFIQLLESAVWEYKKTETGSERSYWVRQPSTLSEIGKMVSEIHIAVGTASLLASDDLCPKLLNVSISAQNILNKLMSLPSNNTVEVPENVVDGVAAMFRSVLQDMRLELGIA